jgi:GT2 family glycosyltransferase
MQAIVICSVGSKSLDVLLASIKAYAPEIPLYISHTEPHKIRNVASVLFPNLAKNFGDAYNATVDVAFRDGFENVIIANDDVVLTPDTIAKMQEDLDLLQSRGFNVGFLGARSDYVLPDQNIRFPTINDEFVGIKYRSEDSIKLSEVVAPIFASISKKAWNAAKFPSTNWYSDNIICHDLRKAGFQHFVSRAYVHHAGSQSVGTDFQKCHEEPREWIRANRPDMYEVIYG